eukprot:2628970-Pyramimonas_sp.AAC.1
MSSGPVSRLPFDEFKRTQREPSRMSQAKQAYTRGCPKQSERFVEDASSETKDFFEDVSSEQAIARGCLQRNERLAEDASSETRDSFEDVSGETRNCSRTYLGLGV